jgi:crotonobetainyl-CoA:carnitine CoA-transferase CaiB-like acyl-CoA transferase
MGPGNLLTGVRILDLTRATSGPFATQILGDLGAEVVKIEEPPGSPFARSVTRPAKQLAGMDPAFLCVNRNKKSVVLQLTDSDDLATFYRLVEHADVVIDNYKPGVTRKLKVDYETLRPINSRIITCSLSGYGRNGPMADRAAFDITILAQTGMLDFINKRDAQGKLALPVVAIADLLGGMYCSVAIPSALQYRSRTGVGCHIDIGMYDAVLSWLVGYAVNELNFTPDPNFYERAIWGVYETATRPLVVTAHREAQWRRLCRAVGRDEWLTDERFIGAEERASNIQELRRLVNDALGEKSADEWMVIFDREGVPYGEILTVEEALSHPQTAAREMIVDATFPTGEQIRMLGNPVKVPGLEQEVAAPPIYGEHTKSVLNDWLGDS